CLGWFVRLQIGWQPSSLEDLSDLGLAGLIGDPETQIYVNAPVAMREKIVSIDQARSGKGVDEGKYDSSQLLLVESQLGLTRNANLFVNSHLRAMVEPLPNESRISCGLWRPQTR